MKGNITQCQANPFGKDGEVKRVTYTEKLGEHRQIKHHMEYCVNLRHTKIVRSLTSVATPSLQHR